MIETKNLYFKYEDNLILKNISIEINDGSFIAIIGANGSGKTTLAKHFNALLLPTKGNVLIDNIDTKKKQFNARKNVGFVFQNAEDQLIYSIVEEDIAFGLENLGIEASDIRKKVKEITKMLGIEHIAKQNVNMLSGGQKQLAALAGVLVMKPKYIVFDEPTAMLDTRNKRNIINIMGNLNKREKIGIILVTNILEDIKHANSIIAIKNGSIIFNGKKSRLSNAVIKRCGLDA
ncbi:ATP-binding cassette domain-containing protein [Candidatus Woesearchaeota archaeon]|nr:ATP-binding cassette domain-containing protein [Candidatus Woesearchaeota archaeon]